jgi:hypothetical protein
MVRSRALSAASIVIALSFAPAPALADEDEAPPRPPQKTWYGWQTLIVDAAATTIAVDGLFRHACLGTGKDCTEMDVGLATFALGAPAVHLAHGSAPKAGGSLALHVLGPPIGGGLGLGAGALLGAAATGGDPLAMTMLGAVGLVLGVGAGWLGAIAVDSLALGYATPAPRVTLQPSIAIVPGRAEAGVGGTF